MTLLSDLQKLQQEHRDVRLEVEELKKQAAQLEEQMNGKRGVQTTLENLLGEIKGLRKAAYWVAGLIVAGSIGFAFSVLQLIGN